MIRVAIVGGRDYNDRVNFETLVCCSLKQWGIALQDIDAIVSGGAKGADAMAAKFAKDHNLQLIEHKPDWDRYSKAAGVLRNTIIVNDATHVIAFPTQQSKGTWDTIKKAKLKGIKCDVYRV